MALCVCLLLGWRVSVGVGGGSYGFHIVVHVIDDGLQSCAPTRTHTCVYGYVSTQRSTAGLYGHQSQRRPNPPGAGGRGRLHRQHTAAVRPDRGRTLCVCALMPLLEFWLFVATSSIPFATAHNPTHLTSARHIYIYLWITHTYITHTFIPHTHAGRYPPGEGLQPFCLVVPPNVRLGGDRGQLQRSGGRGQEVPGEL